MNENSQMTAGLTRRNEDHEIPYFDLLVKELRAGDLQGALMVWQSNGWDDQSRRRAERLIRTGRDMAAEVLA